MGPRDARVSLPRPQRTVVALFDDARARQLRRALRAKRRARHRRVRVVLRPVHRRLRRFHILLGDEVVDRLHGRGGDEASAAALVVFSGRVAPRFTDCIRIGHVLALLPRHPEIGTSRRAAPHRAHAPARTHPTTVASSRCSTARGAFDDSADMLDRSQCVLPVDEPGHNDEMHEMAREGFRCKLHLRRRVAYIEVPKCASTTVSNLLRARGAVEVLVGHPLYALCHELRVNETAPGWFRFTFVRDPLHRLFSTFVRARAPSALAKNVLHALAHTPQRAPNKNAGTMTSRRLRRPRSSPSESAPTRRASSRRCADSTTAPTCRIITTTISSRSSRRPRAVATRAARATAARAPHGELAARSNSSASTLSATSRPSARTGPWSSAVCASLEAQGGCARARATARRAGTRVPKRTPPRAERCPTFERTATTSRPPLSSTRRRSPRSSAAT